MAYDNEKNEKRPVGNHPGAQQQKDDYNKISSGQHTAVRPNHRGQSKIQKGYTKPQPK